MKTDELKEMFGDEYPAAVVVDGIRLPLRSERRFLRSYHSDQQTADQRKGEHKPPEVFQA